MLFWPKMRGEIKDYVANCSAWNEYMHKQQREMMMSHEIHEMNMDLYVYGGREFLIIVDHYSDYWETDQLPDLTACYWQPDQVITENEPQFACELFRKFVGQWGFVHVTSSLQHPQSNRKAESAVKIVKSLCKRAKLNESDPWVASLHWRNTPTEGLDSSPAQ